jgi:hypothetical protein
VAIQHLARNVINTHNTWKAEIEYEEASLETIGNVILASSWVLHGCKVLQVLACLEVTSFAFIKEVENHPTRMTNRTSSNVVWSPHLLTSGMETSSKKIVISLPFGGPKNSYNHACLTWLRSQIVPCHNLSPTKS